MANLDFSNVPGRVLLNEGIYTMEITKIEAKQSSNGNDMWLVTFKEEETGGVVFENYVLLPQNLWKLRELCDATGVVDLSENPIVDPDELAAGLVGCFVKAKVTQDEYQGSPVNRIKKVFAA